MADADKNTNAKTGAMRVRVICPDETIFDGDAQSVIIKTSDGYEGFLKGRAPCARLLADDGQVRVRRAGSDFEIIKTKGGFACMDGTLTIYADEAEWEK